MPLFVSLIKGTQKGGLSGLHCPRPGCLAFLI